MDKFKRTKTVQIQAPDQQPSLAKSAAASPTTPRPRSHRSFSNTLTRMKATVGRSSSPPMEIGPPMNFQHNVKVRKEDDGTYHGMPDEWLQVFLKEVEADKRNGDEEAAADGAKVLRFFQEFSRDGSRNKKEVPKSPPKKTSPTLQKPPPLPPAKNKVN